MKIKKNKLLIYLSLGVLLLLFTHCTTFISDNNMRWTAQYDFIDLYKKKKQWFQSWFRQRIKCGIFTYQKYHCLRSPEKHP